MGTYLVFSVACVHILTRDETNALCRLDEKHIILGIVIYKIQNMPAREISNLQLTRPRVKKGMDRNPCLTKMSNWLHVKLLDVPWLSRFGLLFMVFNATFNNISVISWRSVLLVGETGVPGENYRPVANHWQTLSHDVVSNTPRLGLVRTHNVSGDKYWLHRQLYLIWWWRFNSS